MVEFHELGAVYFLDRLRYAGLGRPEEAKKRRVDRIGPLRAILDCCTVNDILIAKTNSSVERRPICLLDSSLGGFHGRAE